MKRWAVEVSREAGESPMGHAFPAETCLIRDSSGIVTFDSEEDAEKFAQLYRDEPFGFTRKSYRAVPYSGN